MEADLKKYYETVAARLEIKDQSGGGDTEEMPTEKQKRAEKRAGKRKALQSVYLDTEAGVSGRDDGEDEEDEDQASDIEQLVGESSTSQDVTSNRQLDAERARDEVHHAEELHEEVKRRGKKRKEQLIPKSAQKKRKPTEDPKKSKDVNPILAYQKG
jgi:hypothetical protein